MKKLICIFLSIIMIFSVAACSDDPVTPDEPAPVLEKLATPVNVKATESGGVGVITWNAVDGATEYTVTVNGSDKTTTNNYYYIEPLVVDYSVSVTAKAEGYADSDRSSSVMLKKRPVTLGLSGGSVVRSGKTLQLLATVGGTSNTDVSWEITKGGEFATVDDNGKVTAREVTGDKIVTVKATSAADPSVSALKALTVTAKPTLTQSMLDAIETDKISFEGFLTVNLYDFGITDTFRNSYTYDVKTAMDGTNWYAQYQLDASGITSNLYYKNHNGIACMTSVSFMNEEQYTPMLEDDGTETTWEASGLYNNFRGLKVSDFTFNETTWRYELKSTNKALLKRLTAAANPYEFDTKGVALIIADGEIAGFFAEANDDYTIYEDCVARQELTVAINCGDIVDVPTITKYKHDELHDELVTALDNMHSLNSYTTELLNISASYTTSGTYTLEGYIETVTSDVCHFREYTFVPDPTSDLGVGNGIRNFTGVEYGYVYRGDGESDFYNAFYGKNGDFEATRAYEKPMANAKPSFGFVAEIFTGVYRDTEAGTTTYYVDYPMSAVASTFYFGMGNDIALYGLFATEGQTSIDSSFTPYVVVKDGYIVETGFYYYLGYIFGVMQITYSDFDKTETSETMLSKLEEIEVRQVPNNWSQLEIVYTFDEEEHNVNALEYFKSYFEDDEIESKLPFFGDVLGDTYGFGMTTLRIYNKRAVRAAVLYYDVPLDVDMTINTSISAVEEQLVAAGFAKEASGAYIKGNIAAQPVDSSLDMTVYVWKI